MAICVTKPAIQKRSDLNNFQIPETPSISSDLHKSRRLKRHNTPEYRRINSYYKSTVQYWKERNRRKQLIKLVNEGSTLQEAALKIGVSYRTVRREMHKVERYLIGQVHKHLRQIAREHREKIDRDLDALSTTDLFKRYESLSRLFYRTRKLSKKEHWNRHNTVIVLDFDQLNQNGFPKILFKNGVFKTPHSISFVANRNGEPHVLGGLKIG